MKRYFLMILVLVVLTGCNANKSNSTSGSLVELNGQWLFYWNQLIEPEDIKSGKGDLTGLIGMPSNWNEYRLNENNLPRTGFATFVFYLKVSDPEKLRGFLLPVMYSNYKLWIDDELAAESGQIGMNKQQSIPQKFTDVVYFHTNSEQVQIVLQISNYHNYAGGMFEPIVYGLASDIESEHDRNVVEQGLLLGFILLAGIYHIGLSIFRKKDYSVLFFGLFCMSAVIRNMFTGEVLLTQLYPDFSWEIAMKLEYISLYLMLPLLALFIQYLYAEESFKWLTKVSIIIASGYSLVTLVLTADMYYRLLIYFQIYIVIASVLALIIFIRATIHSREGAVYALIGFLALVITSMHDMIIFNFKLSEQSLYSLGVGTFIVCFSFVLSKKISLAFLTTERLAQELTELNEVLDKKVHERTLAIAESNKKLEQLNLQLQEWSMIDGLTGVSNRRHFDDYLSKMLKDSVHNHTPFTLMLVDIDCFKLYNDTYGHIQGDRCLQEVAKAIQSSLPSGDKLVARYGGEEFSVVLPACSKEKAVNIANRICADVRQLQILHVDSDIVETVTVSIGSATVILEADKEPIRLIHIADLKLYKAKSLGRNQACCD